MDELSKKEVAIIDMLKNETEHDIAYYFFRDAKNPKWFSLLSSEKIFSASSIPTPKYNEIGNWSVTQWIVLPYIIRLAKQISEQPNEYDQLGKNIISWMQLVCATMNQEQKKNYTVGNAFLYIISLFPEKYIQMELLENIFALVREIPVLDRNHHIIIMELLPKLFGLSEKKFFYRVLDIIINDLISAKQQESDAVFWFNEFVEKHENELLKCNPNLILELFSNKVVHALTIEQERETHLSLYQKNEKAYYFDTIVDRFIFYLNRLLVGFYVKHKELILEIIKKYLKSSHIAFYKLGWFSLAQLKEKDLNYIFFTKIITDEEIAKKGFASLYAQDELKKVLEKIRPLKEAQNQKMLDFIQLGSKSVPEDARNIWLQKRYSLFCDDIFFEDKYKSLKEITGIDCTLEPYLSIQTGYVSSRSPLQATDILNMPIDELVNRLKVFRGKSFFGDTPSVNGLAEMLESVIKNHATVFPKEWEPFLDVGYIYIYSMLNGLRECEEKRNVPWDKLCSFLMDYIKQAQFLEGTLKVDDDEWKIGVMEFSNMVLLTLRTIPIYCLGMQEIVTYICELSETFKEAPRSAFDSVFNTLRGNSFYSLLLLENYKKNHLPTNAIFHILGLSILKQDRIAHIAFGYLYRELLLLNSSWTNDQRHFIEDNGDNCRTWMLEGYFSSNYIAKDITKGMENLYEYAIGKNFQGVPSGKIAQHMTYMYLYDFFDTEKSKDFFYKYLKESKKNGNYVWNDVLSCINRQESASITQEIFEDKILSFWDYMNKEKKIPLSVRWQAISLIRFSHRPIKKDQFIWIKNTLQLPHMQTNLYQFLNTLENVWGNGDRCSKTKETARYIADWLYVLVQNIENIYFHKENRWYKLIDELIKNGDEATKRTLKDFNDICMKKGCTIFVDIFKQCH